MSLRMNTWTHCYTVQFWNIDDENTTARHGSNLSCVAFICLSYGQGFPLVVSALKTSTFEKTCFDHAERYTNHKRCLANEVRYHSWNKKVQECYDIPDSFDSPKKQRQRLCFLSAGFLTTDQSWLSPHARGNQKKLPENRKLPKFVTTVWCFLC